jgi:hypothetical protein
VADSNLTTAVADRLLLTVTDRNVVFPLKVPVISVQQLLDSLYVVVWQTVATSLYEASGSILNAAWSPYDFYSDTLKIEILPTGSRQPRQRSG